MTGSRRSGPSCVAGKSDTRPDSFLATTPGSLSEFACRHEAKGSRHNEPMLLRTVYTVTPGSAGLHSIDLPLEIPLHAGVQASLCEHQDGFRLLVDRSVDSSRIEVISESGWHRELPGGEREPLPRLRLADDEAPEHVLVDDVVGALSFLTDVPLSLSHPIQEDRFLPEDDEERKLLERYGTNQPHHETSVRVMSRTFSAKVDTEGVTALLGRSAGVRLYADAIKLTLDVAKLRELWRVLESAFGRSDDDLVQLLASYPPAQQLGFAPPELRDLLILRGRASHAQSKAGVDELIAVERECGQALPRLKNLAERVILTKRSWGYPTLAVEELARLQAYVDPNGEQVIFQASDT